MFEGKFINISGGTKKKSKRNNTKVIGVGRECPKCKSVMERRGHKEILPYLLEQPFYFLEWEYCKNCKFVQHFDEMKVVANKQKYEIMNQKRERRRQRIEESNRNQEFLNSL